MSGGSIVSMLERNQLGNAVDEEETEDLDHVFE